jgi:hypothetical protein
MATDETQQVDENVNPAGKVKTFTFQSDRMDSEPNQAESVEIHAIEGTSAIPHNGAISDISDIRERWSGLGSGMASAYASGDVQTLLAIIDAQAAEIASLRLKLDDERASLRQCVRKRDDFYQRWREAVGLPQGVGK